MIMVNISDKGQITLPAEARKQLGMTPRSKVEVEIRGHEMVLHPVKSIKDVKGAFRTSATGKRMDWETVRHQTMEAVSKEIVGEDKG